jgi:hypothetical protein
MSTATTDVTAAQIERVVDAVDREMVARLAGFEACDVEIVRAARETAVEHFQQLVQEGHALEDAARVAAKCAARIAAEVQELEAHRQMQPTSAESARVRIELWGSLQ